MPRVEFQQRMNMIMHGLSEHKLAEVIDFATYLMQKEETEDLLKAQMSSSIYQAWVAPENDIYDEVFADEIQ
jgi:hypothetical protein